MILICSLICVNAIISLDLTYTRTPLVKIEDILPILIYSAKFKNFRTQCYRLILDTQDEDKNADENNLCPQFFQKMRRLKVMSKFLMF